MDLTQQHPVYKTKLAHWLESYDFYRGGNYVLSPGRAVGTASFLVSPEKTSSGVDEEPTRKTPRFRSQTTQSYLYSFVRESRADYIDRIQRSSHPAPIFRHLVDAYASATLRTSPSYVGNLDVEPWATYHDDVDRRGTNFFAFIRQALTYSLVFGLEFAITDKPRFSNTVASREQQLARGERAYSYLVNPIQVPNWSVNSETGALNWFQVLELGPDNRRPGDEWLERAVRYRIWYPTHWELWECTHDLQNRIDADEHPVGEVPVAIAYARRSQESCQAIEADSMLSDVVPADRAIFNRMSLLDHQVYGQAFSQLFLPDDGTNLWAGVDIGVGVAVPYNSEHGQPIMLTPEAKIMLAQWQMVLDQIQMLKETHGVGRGKAEHSKEERSAAALSVESRNENNQVASLAEATEEFDRTIHRHVAAWEGVDDYPRASYSRDVSIRSVSAQINDALQLKALGIPAETMIEIVRPLVIQTMAEQGAPPESVDAAVRALETKMTTMAAESDLEKIGLGIE